MKRLKIVAIFIVAFLLMFEENFSAKIQNRDDSDGQEYGSSKLRRLKRGAAVSYFFELQNACVLLVSFVVDGVLFLFLTTSRHFLPLKLAV